MLFDQYHPQDLLTSSIDDGGVQKLNSSLTSLDFYLLDDINIYLPSLESKATKNDLINDSFNDNSQHQEELFSDFDFAEFNDFEETSDVLAGSIFPEEIDIEKWISQASFPSPPTDTTNSSLFNVEDASPTQSSIGDEYTINKDMVVPPSPSISSTDSSPTPSGKKTKLSVVERKLRKKDQNKTAAEKYRIKKKSERHQLLDRHSKLKDTNKELKLELENLTYRIQQFKQIFADLLPIDKSISN
jgi:hypothetical protein